MSENSGEGKKVEGEAYKRGEGKGRNE